MSLEDIRKEINEIDDKMRTLFDARMECATEVAKVKLETGDSIYKPEREKEMYERFIDNPDYISFLKKVVQLSRRRQYELFLDNEEDGELLDKFLSKDLKDGKLSLKLKTDKSCEEGLNVKAVLSIIADSTLEIGKLEADNTNMVFIVLNVPENEISQKEAYLIKFMLESETV
ncbi:MAG: chorismate mutase [Lachnospiraceae bacterium]|nr:chorismate mutase [Lachnospiraceae bacterium]